VGADLEAALGLDEGLGGGLLLLKDLAAVGPKPRGLLVHAVELPEEVLPLEVPQLLLRREVLLCLLLLLLLLALLRQDALLPAEEEHLPLLGRLLGRLGGLVVCPHGIRPGDLLEQPCQVPGRHRGDALDVPLEDEEVACLDQHADALQLLLVPLVAHDASPVAVHGRVGLGPVRGHAGADGALVGDLLVVPGGVRQDQPDEARRWDLRLCEGGGRVEGSGEHAPAPRREEGARRAPRGRHEKHARGAGA